MNPFLNRVCACMTGVMLVMSCSVKENRDSCPCVLVLDYADTDTDVVLSSDLKISSSGGFVWKDTVDVSGMKDGYRVSVPRTDLHVRAWFGADGCIEGDGIVIPYGEDCPRIYMHVSHLEAAGEICRERIFMRKSHCVMTIITEGEGKIASVMTIAANVSGYDSSGRPVTGDFRYVLNERDLEEGYQVVLPRQTDASMMLELDDGDGNRKAFALGQYIVSSGYDWTSPDLDDLTVTIDYALTEIRMNVNGWESVYKYDIEI